MLKTTINAIITMQVKTAANFDSAIAQAQKGEVNK
jgi:hypothetical protein